METGTPFLVGSPQCSFSLQVGGIMDDETRNRIETLERRVDVQEDFDIAVQNVIREVRDRVAEIEKKLGYFESELVAPDKDFVEIKHMVKEIESTIRGYVERHFLP